MKILFATLLMLGSGPETGMSGLQAENRKEVYLSASGRNTEDKTWKLCRNSDGVSIFQRWIEAEPGRQAREIYAETKIKSTPEQLTEIIRNEKYGTQWLSMADEYKVLRVESESKWIAYSRFNLMPALRFDLVTANEIIRNQPEQIIIIGITGQPDYLPEDKNYKRLPHFEGRWEFVATPDKQVIARYYMYSNIEPFLPRWMTDPFVFNEMETCVLNVKKIAE